MSLQSRANHSRFALRKHTTARSAHCNIGEPLSIRAYLQPVGQTVDEPVIETIFLFPGYSRFQTTPSMVNFTMAVWQMAAWSGIDASLEREASTSCLFLPG